MLHFDTEPTVDYMHDHPRERKFKLRDIMDKNLALPSEEALKNNASRSYLSRNSKKSQSFRVEDPEILSMLKRSSENLVNETRKKNTGIMLQLNDAGSLHKKLRTDALSVMRNEVRKLAGTDEMHT